MACEFAPHVNLALVARGCADGHGLNAPLSEAALLVQTDGSLVAFRHAEPDNFNAWPPRGMVECCREKRSTNAHASCVLAHVHTDEQGGMLYLGLGRVLKRHSADKTVNVVGAKGRAEAFRIGDSLDPPRLGFECPVFCR